MKKKTKKIKNKSVIEHSEWGLLEETYWAPTRRKTLSVSPEFLNEETGKYEKRKIINPSTGFPKMSGSSFDYVSEDISFSVAHFSAGMTHKKEDNSWCFYNVFEKTPSYIKIRLENLHAKKAIYTNDEKMELDNPAHFKEYKANLELKTTNKALDSENKVLLARIKELEGK